MTEPTNDAPTPAKGNCTEKELTRYRWEKKRINKLTLQETCELGDFGKKYGVITKCKVVISIIIAFFLTGFLMIFISKFMELWKIQNEMLLTIISFLGFVKMPFLILLFVISFCSCFDLLEFASKNRFLSTCIKLVLSYIAAALTATSLGFFSSKLIFWNTQNRILLMIISWFGFFKIPLLMILFLASSYYYFNLAQTAVTSVDFDTDEVVDTHGEAYAKSIYHIRQEKKKLKVSIKQKEDKYGGDPRSKYQKFIDNLNDTANQFKYFKG